MAAPDPFKGRIHIKLGARTACGRDAATVNTVPPHLAKHLTCEACRRSLLRAT
jgi:hypothetical protein